MIFGFRLRAASFGLALGLAVQGATLAFAAVPTEPNRIVVNLDQAKLVKLPDHVETIVVGSPIIAGVDMVKHGLVVITGKGFGQTNVIFLDNTGQAVSEALVTVQESPGLVTVQRGIDRESYACTPRCQPAIALGDASKFLSETSSQITSRNGLAAPSR